MAGELLPLTLAQTEVWNAQRLLGIDDLYNIGAWTVIEGPIDIERLRAACQRAMREGASLCCTIVPTAEGPRQQCNADTVMEIPLLDLAGEPDPEAAARAHMRERFRRPFDLANGPVARVELLRIAPQRLLLYFVAHHLFTDLYGGRAMLQRAAAIYDATADDAATLTPWHEVLTEERAYRDSRRWARDRAAWLGLLQSRPAAATLSGRAGVAYPDATHSATVQVPRATLVQLAELAGRDAAGTASAVLAIVALYLARAGSSDDILLGMAMSGRVGRRLRRASGFLSNVVPVRLQVDTARPFRVLLHAAAAQLRHAMQGQRYPASALRADLGLAAGDPPLFATRLNFMPSDADASFDGRPAQLHAFTHAPRVEDLSITVHARRESGDLRIDLDGRASHYSEAALALHAANLSRLLAEVAERPDVPAGELLQPTAAERERLLAQWGDGGPAPTSQTLLQRLAQWATEAPRDVAVTDGTRTLDFAALDARSEQVAQQLRALGVGAESIVGLWADRSLAMIVGLLGIWKAGGAWIGLEPNLPDERLRHMLRDTRARVVVAADGAARAAVCDGLAVSSVAEQPAAPLDTQRADAAMPDPHAAAYLIHTSGSTGTPKAVVVPHAGIAVLAAAQSRHVGMDRTSRALQLASLGFDASVAEIVTSLWSGAALVLAPAHALSGTPLRELLQREGITHATLTPTVLDTLPATAGPKLQGLIVAGEACPRHLVDAWSGRVAMFNAYGPSECTVCATMSAPLAPGADATIGRPIAGTRVYVVDAQLRLLPPGMTGELCIAGSGVARGYHGRPRLTAERFVPDPFGAHGERMYRSGDRVRWTAAGELEFLGRNDDQLKLRGQRIEPGEIEAALAAQPEVESAAVTLQDADGRGRALVAFLVARDGHAPSSQNLAAALAARLPRAMIPSRFVWLPALPRTLGGKLDRRALAALRPQPDDTPREAPQGGTEQAIAALWRQLLQVTELSRHDDFFALGGNSLLLTQLAEALSQRGWMLEPGALFASPTIAMLAAAIDARGEPTATAALAAPDPSQRSIVAASVPGGTANVQDIYPLVPLQAGLLVQHRALDRDPYVSRLLLEFGQRARLDEFIAALRQMVARHDALRTAMLWEGLPEPLQVVWRQAELPVEWPAAGASADAATLWAREPQSLDVTRAPMLHIAAMPDPDQRRWRVLLQLHHLVVDLASLHIILAEVARCLQGEAAALPPALPFRNFVAGALAAAGSPHHAAFFRGMLAGLAAPTRPFGIADTRTDGAGIEEARLQLDTALVARLRAQAQRHAVLPSSLFHVAWAEVLARATGGRDVVFGTVLSGRQGTAAGVVGLCINTLPMRVELADKPPAVVVAEVQARLAALLAHEQAPAAAALDANPLPGTSLFTSILNFRQDPLRIASGEATQLMPGVTLLHLAQRTNYRLGLCVDQQPDGFCLTAQAEPQVGATQVCTLVRDALGALVSALEQAAVAVRADAASAASEPGDSSNVIADGNTTEPPRSQTERQLAGIWCEVLRRQAVGREDDFFMLGGHSLLALQVVSRVRDAFGVELPLKALFDTPRLAALAALLDTLRGARGAVEHRRIESRRWQGPAPLSYSQERMWLIQRMNPTNVAYNMPAAVWIRGELDGALLGHCLDELVERHDVLRTHVLTAQGEPSAVVSRPRRGLLEHIDFRGQADAAGQALEFITRGVRELFDLARGPVLRAWLVRTGEREYLFGFVVHHIASDQWSMGIIGREVAQLYQWRRQGRHDQLPQLPIGYRDFAAWQRGADFTARLAGQLAFWRTRLAELPTIDLPIDLPRPRLWTMNGELVRRQLPPELLPALARLASARSATPFMVLFAGLAALLNRITGQHDLPIGVPVAGRTHHAVEGLVGTFVNTLVLRADLDGELSFTQLVTRVRDLALEAFANPDVPFDRLVQELGQRGDRSRAPLAQVLFNVANAPMHGLELDGASWEEQPLARGGSQFELSFTVDTTGTDQLGLEFNSDLFTRPAAERLADEYIALLAAAVAEPARRLDQLDILPPAQRNALRGFNATRQALPAGVTLPRLFAEQVARAPSRIALQFEGQALDYSGLDAAVTQLAQRLRSAGAGRGEVVAVCMARSPWLVVALLAVQRSGAAYLPLDPQFPVARLSYMLKDSGARLVVTQGALPPGLQLPEGVAGIEVQPGAAAAPGGTTAAGGVDALPAPEDAAYILYTSGSTGLPKGVVVPHGALANFLLSMRDAPGLSASDVLAAVTTVSFDIAGLELYLPLITGARIELLSREVASDGTALAQALQQCGATIMQATPATWRMLIEAGWRGAPGFRALCGGEALSRHLADELLDRCGELWNMYGPTETTIWSTLDRVARAEPITIGRPIANTQVHVVNAQGLPCPLGVAGEIWIGGDGVALGYHARAELTTERFIADGFAPLPGKRLYRTGDLGRWLPDGRLQHLGRIDHQVKVRGFRIELGEIEQVLATHPQVLASVATVREARADDPRLIAYIVFRDGERSTGTDIKRFLREQLPEYAVPSIVMPVERIPQTPSGKTDRAALPDPFVALTGEFPVLEALEGGTEEQLGAIWSEVLGVGWVGPHDNFFELGGHSLLSLRVALLVQQRSGRVLDPRLLFFSTLREIARNVDGDDPVREWRST